MKNHCAAAEEQGENISDILYDFRNTWPNSMEVTASVEFTKLNRRSDLFLIG